MPTAQGINKIANTNTKVLTSISRRIACKENQLISEKVTMQTPLATHRRAGHDTTFCLQNLDSNLGVIPRSHEHFAAEVDSKPVSRKRSKLRREK